MRAASCQPSASPDEHDERRHGVESSLTVPRASSRAAYGTTRTTSPAPAMSLWVVT